MEEHPILTFELADLPKLLDALQRRDYRIVAPTLRNGAILYEEIASVVDLPAGWTDEQDGGTYRLVKRDDAALFGYAVGPHSWKQFLFPPVTRLWQAERTGNGFRFLDQEEEPAKYAFLGVRSCELHAIRIQDRVFLGGSFVDPVYKARRDGLFIVAVNCGQAGGTCFCVSMGTGPRSTAGFDLALTEVLQDGRQYFTAEVGSERGAEVLTEVGAATAKEDEVRAAEEVIAQTASSMGRSMDNSGIKELLYRNYEHPRWEEVATRCLTCGNCTLVCPTCFCSSVEDVSDVNGNRAERWRKWDSCFTMDHSYLHGGSVRGTPRSRYRQWMTHKLATWYDQFGTSGCVGCGRCITWCPVAIDITEEVTAIRQSERQD